MFLENQVFPANSIDDDRISRAINNDHTAAMKAPSDTKKHKKKGGAPYPASDMITICMLCQKAFKSAAFYRKHLRLHSSDKAHCPLCGKAVRKHLLAAHKRLKHKHHLSTSSSGKHKQPSPLSITGHMPSKSSGRSSSSGEDADREGSGVERPFCCSLCPKAFNIKSSLQRHLSCHTGEKPFLCGLCGRGYTRRSVLQLHVQQVHEARKPFECGACGLCFSQKGNLQAHYRRKHTQHPPPPPPQHPTTTTKRGGGGGKGKRKTPRTEQHPPTSSSSLHSYASKVKAIVSRGGQRTNVQYSEPHPPLRVPNKYSEPHSSARGSNKYTPNKYSHPSSKGPGKYSEPLHPPNKYSEPTPSSRSLGKYSEPLHSPNKYSHPSSKGPSKYSEPLHTPTKYSEPTPSSRSLGKYSEPLRVFSKYSEPTPQSSSSSLDSLSDSSGNEDLVLDSIQDVKPILPDLESLLEGEGWEEYMMADTILGGGSTSYELLAHTKNYELLPKNGELGWTDDCPLFTAEDLDEIGEISGNVYGLDGITIKQEPLEILDTRAPQRGHTSYRGYHLQA